MFTDMPGETDVIQHNIKLTDDTPVRFKPLCHERRIAEQSR